MRRVANLCRTVRLNRGTRGHRNVKKRVAYKRHLGSAYFQALRLACFERDGFCCQCGCGTGPYEASQLACDHLTYRNFGHELLDDVTTMLREHHDAKDGWKWQGWRT